MAVEEITIRVDAEAAQGYRAASERVDVQDPTAVAGWVFDVRAEPDDPEVLERQADIDAGPSKRPLRIGSEVVPAALVVHDVVAALLLARLRRNGSVRRNRGGHTLELGVDPSGRTVERPDDEGRSRAENEQHEDSHDEEDPAAHGAGSVCQRSGMPQLWSG